MNKKRMSRIDTNRIDDVKGVFIINTINSIIDEINKLSNDINDIKVSVEKLHRDSRIQHINMKKSQRLFVNSTSVDNHSLYKKNK